MITIKFPLHIYAGSLRDKEGNPIMEPICGHNDLLNKEQAEEFLNVTCELINSELEGKQHRFPNGFANWHETHYEVVSFITIHNEHPVIAGVDGTGGRYELAELWTNEFERLNTGREWDGEFFDEIEVFLKGKLKPVNVENKALYYLKDNATGKLLTARLTDGRFDISFTDNKELAYGFETEAECIQFEDDHANEFSEYCTPVKL